MGSVGRGAGGRRAWAGRRVAGLAFLSLFGVLGPALLGACSLRPAESGGAPTGQLRPSTVEGPPRSFRVIELVRHARTAPRQSVVDVEACRWHVTGAGVFYGDHWGWCEDFAVLPRTSPGYLVLTTAFSGGVRGAYSRLAVLPPLPANVAIFGGTLGLAVAGGAGQDGPDVQVTFAGQTATLRPRVPVDLGGAGGESLVEPPPDSGHFETGLFQPVPAAVTYTAISYGALDSRRIAGRGAS